MSALPIIKTKLIPPRNTAHTIMRTRLFRRLDASLTRRLTVVSAGGGWGKSVLLTSFLSSGRNPFVWYSLDLNDLDPLVFLVHIAEGISQRLGAAGQKTLKALRDSGDNVSWRFVAATLFNEILDNLPGPFLLVLDDHHSVNSSETMADVLNYFIKLSPPSVHMIISTREKPALQLEKLKAHGELLELGAADLRFNKEEIGSLFQTTYHLDLAPHHIELIEGRTEGWVIGLRLIGDALARKSPADIARFLSGLKGMGGSLFNYFKEEVYRGLPDDVRVFLKETSILNRFNASIYGVMSGKEGSSGIMDALLKRELFLIRMDEEEGRWFRYHHLFREFLQGLLKHDESPDHIRRLHKKAASFFMETGEPEDVIYHLIQAGDYKNASAVIEKKIGYVFSSSFAQSLTFWIEQIPEQELAAHAGLLFGKGWTSYVKGSWYTALGYLERAMDMAIRDADQPLLGKAAYFVLIIYISQESFEEARKVAEDTLPHLGPASLEMLICLMLYAMALMYLNRPGEALRTWNEVLGPLSRIDRAFYLTALSGKGYEYCFPMGMLGKAVHNIEEAVSYFKDSDPLGVYGVTLLFLAEVRHEMGFFEEAAALSEEAIREKKKRGLIFTLPVAYNLQAINALFMGDYEKARESIGLSAALISKTNAPKLWRQHHLNVARALLAFCDNDRETFYRYAGEALKESLRINDYFDYYRVSCWLAPCYTRIGDETRAMGLLEDSIAKAGAIGNAYGQARGHLLLASITYDNGNVPLAGKHLEEALSIGTTGDHDFLFLQKERNHAAKLLPFAVSEKLHIPCAVRLLAGFKKECAGPVLALLNHRDPKVRESAVQILTGMEYREAEREFVELLKDPIQEVRRSAGEGMEHLSTLPPVPLRIYLLGEFRLFVGDSEVPRTAWKRKAAKSILKYLVFNHEKEVSRETLMDMFFEEKTAAAGGEIFRQSMSSLRRILEPGIPAHRESRYLKIREGRYRLDLPSGSYVDAFEFDRFCKIALGAGQEGDVHLALFCWQSAVKLYRGDFLAEDINEKWTAFLRVKYTDMYLKAQKDMAQYHFKRFEYDLSIEALHEILERDEWDEDAYLLLMKCHLALGDRSAAIKVYRKCSRILANELDIEPTDALSDLYKALLKAR